MSTEPSPDDNELSTVTDRDTPQQALAHAADHLVVAIDGPAGAGKSTLAAHLAARFGLLNLETGAMYRAFAFKVLKQKISPEDPARLEQLLSVTTIDLESTGSANRVLLDGHDVTADLRNPRVTAAASLVSVHPAVRRWLVGLQRAMGQAGGVVMEGRDIGTAVFPHAQVKIFLDASPEKRSERRYAQTPDVSETSAAVLNEMKERDQRDRNRADSPLRPAEDAVMIDSTNLSLDEVISQAESIITERLLAARHR